MESQASATPRFERDGSILRFGEGAAARVRHGLHAADHADRVRRRGPGPRALVSSGRATGPARPVHLDDGEPVRMATTDLRVEVSTTPLRLTFLDTAGTLLLCEPAEGGMTAERSEDGRRRVHARFAFGGEQHFYGLGQGGLALDRLGVSRQLWNTHLGHGPGSDMGVPLLLSNRGYALFFDNSSDAQITVGRSDGGVRIVYTAASGTAHVVLPDRPGPPRGDARGGGAARPRADAPALGARIPPVDPSLPRHRGAAPASAHDPGQAHPLRRAHLPLDLRRGARLEPRRRTPRVPARALAGSRRPPRGRAGLSTSS